MKDVSAHFPASALFATPAQPVHPALSAQPVPSTLPARLSSEQEVSDRLVPVVIGAGIFGYSCVRSFHGAYGLKTIIVTGVDVKVVSSSRFCDYRITGDYDNEEALLAYLLKLGAELASQGKLGLILGNADWHARLISAHKRELSEFYVVPYVDFETMRAITDKRSFYNICQELSIPYPRTISVGCAPSSPDIDVEALTYPLVAKPANSSRYDTLSFEGKEKVFEISEPKRLREVIELLRVSDYNEQLIIQDFVPGPDDAMRSLTIFAVGGVSCACSGGRVMIQDRDPLFIGNPDCIMGERTPEIISCGQRFVEHVGYTGFANFDIKYDERDGSYRFFEINARAGRNTFYMTLGGLDFVRPLVETCVLGRDFPYTEAYEPFVYTVLPRAAIKRTARLDKQSRNDVLRLFDEGRAQHPYDYPPETLAHKWWTFVTKLHKTMKA